MVRGYDYGDDLTGDFRKQLEQKYNGLILSHLESLNHKNSTIKQYGGIIKAKKELGLLKNIQDILSLKQEIDLYKPFYEITGHCFTGGLDLNKEITLLLKELRLPVKNDSKEQLKRVKNRIIKKRNNLKKLEKALLLAKENRKYASENQDVSKTITSVELILERSIDMEKTSLYRFCVMQEMAHKKVKKQAQNHGKRQTGGSTGRRNS